jgi:PhnB protein
MPHVNAYLIFDGNCGEAMRHYQRTLGGTLDVMTFATSPMAKEMPPGNADRVMHARLEIPGGVLMASDCMQGMQYDGIQGTFVSVQYAPGAEDTVRRVFDALADGGRVEMPLQKTFWAAQFGMLVDRYGARWMVHC